MSRLIKIYTVCIDICFGLPAETVNGAFPVTWLGVFSPISVLFGQTYFHH